MSNMAKVTPTISFLYRRYHSTWELKDADRVFALMVAEARRLASTTDEIGTPTYFAHFDNKNTFGYEKTARIFGGLKLGVTYIF